MGCDLEQLPGAAIGVHSSGSGEKTHEGVRIGSLELPGHVAAESVPLGARPDLSNRRTAGDFGDGGEEANVVPLAVLVTVHRLPLQEQGLHEVAGGRNGGRDRRRYPINCVECELPREWHAGCGPVGGTQRFAGRQPSRSSGQRHECNVVGIS